MPASHSVPRRLVSTSTRRPLAPPEETMRTHHSGQRLPGWGVPHRMATEEPVHASNRTPPALPPRNTTAAHSGPTDLLWTNEEPTLHASWNQDDIVRPFVSRNISSDKGTRSVPWLLVHGAAVSMVVTSARKAGPASQSGPTCRPSGLMSGSTALTEYEACRHLSGPCGRNSRPCTPC